MKTKTLSLFALLIILSLFALPAFAQEASEAPEALSYAVPAVLLGLIGANYRATEAFKKALLNVKRLNEQYRPLVVLVFSVGFGIVSAWATPTATDWLMPKFEAYPYHAIALTGFAVSTVGGIVWEVMGYLSSKPATSVKVVTADAQSSVKAEVKPQA